LYANEDGTRLEGDEGPEGGDSVEVDLRQSDWPWTIRGVLRVEDFQTAGRNRARPFPVFGDKSPRAFERVRRSQRSGVERRGLSMDERDWPRGWAVLGLQSSSLPGDWYGGSERLSRRLPFGENEETGFIASIDDEISAHKEEMRTYRGEGTTLLEREGTIEREVVSLEDGDSVGIYSQRFPLGNQELLEGSFRWVAGGLRFPVRRRETIEEATWILRDQDLSGESTTSERGDLEESRSSLLRGTIEIPARPMGRSREGKVLRERRAERREPNRGRGPSVSLSDDRGSRTQETIGEALVLGPTILLPSLITPYTEGREGSV